MWEKSTPPQMGELAGSLEEQLEQKQKGDKSPRGVARERDQCLEREGEKRVQTDRDRRMHNEREASRVEKSKSNEKRCFEGMRMLFSQKVTVA